MDKSGLSGKMLVSELNERSREVFRLIVEGYMETGEPVGSRTLARALADDLSPATIRNVMADLQDAGLLFSTHTSSGRLPTEAGMRLFVDGLMEFGPLSKQDCTAIENRCEASGNSVSELFEEASEILSGLSRCAGMVMAPKTESPLKHIELVQLGPRRALVVMVTESGLVENRVIGVPEGMIPSSLIEAGNFLNARLVGKTLPDTRDEILAEIETHRAQLDEMTAQVVEAGIAERGGETASQTLVVKGQANLLENVQALEDLEHIRRLMAALETREGLVGLLEAADTAEGVQIFIGAENQLFGLSGCSMIVAPFRTEQRQIVGAVGVVGPTRINYARIIPMVDYTAKIVGRLIG